MGLFIAKLIIVVSIIYIIKLFIYPIFKPLSKRHKMSARGYKLQREKLQKQEKRKARFKKIARKTCKNLLTESDRIRFDKIIYRLELKKEPEELRLQQICYAGGGVIVTLLAYTANPLLSYLSAMLVILGWLYPINDLENQIETKDKNIATEFPAFYSMIYYQYSKSVNIHLSDVIKDYLPNANADMASELGVMLDNIEYGEEYALKQFKKRVPLRYIIRFCDILETRLNGYDNVAQMTFLKNELDEYRILNLEKELTNRREANERIQLILIVVLIIYIIMYYAFMVLQSINLFK